jgi:hypothetical protein
MTAQETEELKRLLALFYRILDRVQKEQPNNEALINRVLDNINDTRKLLEL